MKTHATKPKATGAARRTAVPPALGLGNRPQIRQIRGGVQAKLTVGRPDDPAEREADQIAEQVLRMPVSAIEQGVPERLQRSCTSCREDELQRQVEDDEEEEEELLQPKAQAGCAAAVDGSTVSAVRALRGGGQPLDAQSRGFFEPRFGRDFSQVRVHADGRAAGTAQALRARAYTLGSDVVFAAGEYRPHGGEGRRLLAHELTHVVQQGRAGAQLQRRMNDGHDLTADRFAGNRTLEAVYDNERLIRRGNRGRAVRLIQESLIAQGYDLHVFGADGIFGAETEAAVRLFQIDTGAEKLDGIIGPETMTLLNLHDTGATVSTRRPAAGVTPAATGAVFSEHAGEQFAGYDDSTAPHWLVVPENGRRHARVTPNPANARPTYHTLNNAVATVEPTPDGAAVTGVADGNTEIEAREGATRLDRLRVEVKTRMDRTVDYHFMSDSAVPPHATTRVPGDAPTLTATINRIWERQANVRFRTGTVDSPVIPGDLGGQVLWTATLPNEWNTVTAFATGGDYNVFLVWEYEQDATPLVDNTNAGTLAGSTLLEDIECGDALTVAHEAGHFLNMAMPHTAAGIMSGCPGAQRRRVRKNIADQVNL